MQVNEVLKYIRQPHLLNKASIPELQKLVNDFPYFQSAHILLSLASKKWDDSVYQQSIKRTAIVVSNRAQLYLLINKEESENITEELKVNSDKLKVVSEENNTQTDKQKLETSNQKQETSNQRFDKLSDQQQETGNQRFDKLSDQQKETITPKIDETSVETELEKALVSSFVEKEVLKIDIEKTGHPSSFTQWLEFLKTNEGAAEELVKKDNKAKTFEKVQQDQIKKTRQKQKDLIDKIIQSNPGPLRPKEEQKFFKSDQQAKESLLENEHLITETLAQLYASQGAIPKAIRSYEILSLKFPQKSAYFASLIQKLKDSQKKQ